MLGFCPKMREKWKNSAKLQQETAKCCQYVKKSLPMKSNQECQPILEKNRGVRISRFHRFTQTCVRIFMALYII